MAERARAERDFPHTKQVPDLIVGSLPVTLGVVLMSDLRSRGPEGEGFVQFSFEKVETPSTQSPLSSPDKVQISIIRVGQGNIMIVKELVGVKIEDR